MKILIAKAKWEAWDEPLESFLERAAHDKFQATEIYIPSVSEGPLALKEGHRRHGLALVAQITTLGNSPREHLRHLEEVFARAMECDPVAVNCHTGADWFSFAENMALFEKALELERAAGIPLCHELHRGRALYNAPGALRYSQELPDLKFTADFSHWQVVHESDSLDRHRQSLAAVIERSHHIHARVGFSQGPQVPDPRAPEWGSQLKICLGWWRKIASIRARSGSSVLTATPEFGPVPYMPTIPFENRPTADAWQVNCWMRGQLESALGDPVVAECASTKNIV